MSGFNPSLSVILMVGMMLNTITCLAQIENYALQLDRTDGIVIPHHERTSFGQSDEFTLEFWFKLNREKEYYHILGKQEVCSDYHNNYRISGKDKVLTFSSSGGVMEIGTEPLVREWMHLAISYDGTRLFAYVNGCLVKQQPYSLGGKNTDNILIGNAGDCPKNQGFAGEIDEIRIWEVARTPFEIYRNYTNALDTRSTGLVGYWTFDVGEGTELLDLTGKHQTASLNNVTGEIEPKWVENDGPLKTHPFAYAETFEDQALEEMVSINSTGDFLEEPGIKKNNDFDSEFSFGFGISNCESAFCYDDYVTNYVIEFPKPTFVILLSFLEKELFGNSGSQGQIFIDGQQLNLNQDFGREPENDLKADQFFRTFQLLINKRVTSIQIQVRDITRKSEIYVDDIKITSLDPKVRAKNHFDYEIEATGDSSYCPGQEVLLSVPSDDDYAYVWKQNGNPLDLDQAEIATLEPGDYSVEVSSQRCQTFLFGDTITIGVEEITQPPEIYIEGSMSACLGDSVLLYTEEIDDYHYVWLRNGEPVGQDTNMIYVEQSGTYWLEINNGCDKAESTRDFMVDFTYCDKVGCVIFPNAFSPNNDGLNDEFKPIINCDLLSYELQITNRWGEVIFMSQDPLQGWDGHIQGQSYMSNAYLYQVIYQYDDGTGSLPQKVEHGVITLVL